MSSFTVVILLHALLADGFEIHGEHQAEHVTALWRKPKTSHGSIAQRMQVEIGPDSQKRYNVTTKLQDMTSEYTGYIGVGTSNDGGPQFQARVVFDTGSTNLWVASVLCKESPCTSSSSSKFYDPEKSLSQEPFTKNSGHDIDIMFGTGELKGPLHVDTYRVGPMSVVKQPFAMIREMNGEVFSSFPFEGILGLAFRSLSFGGIDPFFERVIEQKLLQSNEFAFYLNADSSQPSALLWGGIDKSLYSGQIRMFPVVQTHYWALELVDFRIGKKSMKSGIKRVIVDSGTTYFTAPTSIYHDIVSKIPEDSCKKVEKYEPLTYVLKDAQGDLFELVVTQATYMIGDETQTSCRPAFMQLDVNNKYGPAMILGEVFMRHFFTVFSRGDGSDAQAKIGFASAKMGAQPKVTPDKKPSFLQLDGGAQISLMRKEAHDAM